MSRAFDVSQEASLFSSSDVDSSDNDDDSEIKLPKPKIKTPQFPHTYWPGGRLGQNNRSKTRTFNYIKKVLKDVKMGKSQTETQRNPKDDIIEETKSSSVRSNQEQRTEPEKEPDFSADVIKETTNNTQITNHDFDNFKKQTKILHKSTTQRLDTETYELEKFNKNAMVIFNHEFFYDGRRRLGTHFDVAALEDTFKQFGFDVVTHNDLKEHDLFDKLRTFSKRNFSDYGCICVAILTHGQDQGFLRAYDIKYSERKVIACFNALNNPSLAAKPIIILIQACRGPTAAGSVPQYASSQFPSVELDADTTGSGNRPTESDMIIFHSSFFGRASVRVVEEGTWFIQTICEQMKLHASTDHLEKLFRRVRKIVALQKEFNGLKQMPAVTTTLLKKLYLKEKIKEDGPADITDHTDGSDSGLVVPVENGIKEESTENILHFAIMRAIVALSSLFNLDFIHTIRHKAHTEYTAFRPYWRIVTDENVKLNLLKHIQLFAIVFLVAYVIFYINVLVSTCVLLLLLFLFEGIRFTSYAPYIMIRQPRYFALFLILFNYVHRFQFFNKDQEDIVMFSFIFGCWYFVGGTFIVYFIVAIYFINDSVLDM